MVNPDLLTTCPQHDHQCYSDQEDEEDLDLLSDDDNDNHSCHCQLCQTDYTWRPLPPSPSLIIPPLHHHPNPDLPLHNHLQPQRSSVDSCPCQWMMDPIYDTALS